MKKIVVIDNIVNELEQLYIKKHLFDDTKWSFIEDVSLKDNLHQRRPGFKQYFNTKNLNDSIYNIVVNVRKKLKMKPLYAKGDILEARSFLQLPLNKEYIGEGVDTPHLDRTEPHLVFLYYVNDSDGDTLLFNDKLDIIRRVKPKKGRMLLFEGNTLHTSSHPTKSDYRMCINIDYHD